MNIRLPGVAVIALNIASTIAAAQPTPAFTSVTTGVRLDVGVFDGTQPVRRLTKEDFEVFDERVRQEIAIVETENAPLDLLLVVQPLASVPGEGHALIQASTGEVARALRSGDRYGVVIGSAPPVLARPLIDADRPGAAAVSGAAGVALRDAIVHALLLFDRQDRRKAVIVFTDGLEDRSWILPTAVKEAADRAPAQVIVAGLGTKSSFLAHTAWNDGSRAGEHVTSFGGRPELELPRWLIEVAERSGGGALDLRRGQAADQLSRVLNALRTQYVITYTPTGTSTAGWHDVKVVLKGRKGTVVTRSGYWANR